MFSYIHYGVNDTGPGVPGVGGFASLASQEESESVRLTGKGCA